MGANNPNDSAAAAAEAMAVFARMAEFHHAALTTYRRQRNDATRVREALAAGARGVTQADMQSALHIVSAARNALDAAERTLVQALIRWREARGSIT